MEEWRMEWDLGNSGGLVAHDVERYCMRPGPTLGPQQQLQWWRPLPAGTHDPLDLQMLETLPHQLDKVPRLIRIVGLRSIQKQQYLATEHLPHHRSLTHLIADGKPFREAFIWSTLHQLAQLAFDLDTIKLPRLCCNLFHTDNIFFDSDTQIKVDPFVFTSEIPETYRCTNLTCSIGNVLYQMCTFDKYSESVEQPFQYSTDLKKILYDLLHANAKKCSVKPSVLLRHPIVLMNLDDRKEMYSVLPDLQTSTPTSDSAFESDESAKIEALFSSANLSIISDSKPGELSPVVAALDLNIPGYVPPRLSDNVRKWKSRLELYKEPEEVSKDALSRVWLDRLKTLCEREKAIELKEKELAKKELFDMVRSTIPKEEDDNIVNEIKTEADGITLQTVMTDKLLPNNGRYNINISETKSILPESDTRYKKPHRRSCGKTKYKRRNILSYNDFDSSLSADPGDTSIVMTSAKISSKTVPRPSIISNPMRKKVHFTSRNNPFAEYDSVSSTIFTFNDDNDQSYEIPLQNPTDNVIDRIAKFTYLDLESITDKKRAQMEEWRKSPTKIKPSESTVLRDNILMAPPVVCERKATRKSKYPSPRYSSTSQMNYYSSNNSESSGVSLLSLPCSSQMKDRRKSMPFMSLGRNQINSKTSEKKKDSENKENVKNAQSCYNLRSKKTSNDSQKMLAVSSEKLDAVKTPTNKRRLSIFSFKTPFKF